jgi:hypothetical protein
MKTKRERLKPLTAQGMSLEELIRCVMSADPMPLKEQEKREREEKEARKRKKKEQERKA